MTAVFAAVAATVSLPGAGRIHQNFDFNWRFHQGDAAGAEQAAFDDATWRKLDVPHDWSIEGTFAESEPTGGSGGYVPAGVGWYRKRFKVPAELKGRRLTVQFDGVYANSDVWLNGRHLGRWPYGYTTFHYDLTPHLKFGDEVNVIAVRADNTVQPASRWYAGAGIYRHVWLTAMDPVHVPPWGVYVTTPRANAEVATVRIRTRLRNGSPAAQELTVESQILDGDGRVVGTVSATQSVSVGGESEFDQNVAITAPHLWSPTTPSLYRARTVVKRGAEILDEVETGFGVRSLAYDTNRGFLLNGQPTKMLGMCVHHDGGAVGAAVPEGVLERRLRLLKEMGCNAVRTAHNPMAPEFYDLCDRIGLLVMDEAFDEWKVRKPRLQTGYSAAFDEWHERDLVNFIRRDRNHPSVVMWSAGNEIGDQHHPEGPATTRRLVEIFHREDPTRPVTAGLDCVYDPNRGSAPVALTEALDVVGYNYVDRFGSRRETYFAEDRLAFPKRIFIGTEDTAVRGIRGAHGFRAMPPGTPERATYATGMIQTAELWKFALTHDYVIGHFMWTGIDYLGEATWPNKNASSGAIDTCGFRKDGFYFYQSVFSEKPMLHLLPHWNWPDRERQVLPVVAFTNCDVVELFLNGRSLGAKAREFPRPGATRSYRTYGKPQVSPTTADLHLSWDVLFEPGMLKAVGYRDGKVACEAVVRTAGAPAALALAVDRDTLRAGARDVAHLEVKVVDRDGVVVPDAEHEIRFEVQGAARLIGVDNGNPASHEPFKADVRKAFHGLCLGIIQAGPSAGEVRVRVTAAGLEPGTFKLRSVPAESRNPKAAVTEID
jgi:beta-galactosidase